MGQARPAHGLSQSCVTEPDQARREVGIDLSALLGVEVGDLTGHGEGAVLGQLAPTERGEGEGQVVAQPARQEHAPLPCVRAGQGGEGDLGPDRHRAWWRTSPGGHVLAVSGI